MNNLKGALGKKTLSYSSTNSITKGLGGGNSAEQIFKEEIERFEQYLGRSQTAQTFEEFVEYADHEFRQDPSLHNMRNSMSDETFKLGMKDLYNGVIIEKKITHLNKEDLKGMVRGSPTNINPSIVTKKGIKVIKYRNKKGQFAKKL